jgi:hypothetical protein
VKAKYRLWCDEEIDHLKALVASGASALRASVAPKRRWCRSRRKRASLARYRNGELNKERYTRPQQDQYARKLGSEVLDPRAWCFERGVAKGRREGWQFGRHCSERTSQPLNRWLPITSIFVDSKTVADKGGQELPDDATAEKIAKAIANACLDNGQSYCVTTSQYW